MTFSSCCQTAAPAKAAAASSSCAAPQPSAVPDSHYNPIAAEFVAIGAAIGANCEPCLRHHTREAMKLGISADDIAKAVAFAATVKETPAQNILKLAQRLTQPGGEASGAANCGCGT